MEEAIAETAATDKEIVPERRGDVKQAAVDSRFCKWTSANSRADFPIDSAAAAHRCRCVRL